MIHLLFGPRPWSYGPMLIGRRRGKPTWHEVPPRSPQTTRVLFFCGSRAGGEALTVQGRTWQWAVTKNPAEATCARCKVELDALLERGLATVVKAKGGALVALKAGKMTDAELLQVATSGAAWLGTRPALPPAHGPDQGGSAAAGGGGEVSQGSARAQVGHDVGDRAVPRGG